MSIKGNLVGNISPRTNWNQTDSARADYLVGREKIAESIAEAKSAGINAATAAEQNSNNYAKTVSDTAETNAKTYAKTYADSKHKVLTATLPASGWAVESSTGFYAQTVTVDGLLASDTIIFDVGVNTVANQVIINEEWNPVHAEMAGDGKFFIRVAERPSIDINVQFSCVRE